MLHRQREQVDIGDLLVPMHTREVDMGVVAQRNIIGPGLVVELGAGLAQAPASKARTPQMPSRSISSRTCSGVMISSR